MYKVCTKYVQSMYKVHLTVVTLLSAKQLQMLFFVSFDFKLVVGLV